MAEQRVQRRLTAILAADIVGYSRMMGEDEAGTLARVNAVRKELFYPKVSEYGGRIVKTMGDGALVEFPSAVDAVQHSLEVQNAIERWNGDEPDDRRILLRIGINIGDIIVEDGDIYGDGVNVAARLEALAKPGGVCISGAVFDQIKGKLDLPFEDLGAQRLKNIAEAVRVYQWPAGDKAAAIETEFDNRRRALAKPSIAVLPFDNMSGDPEQEYFADGLVEDIITTLSKLSGLVVIARNSSFVYKGRAVDVREAARELGVRYILEGSVRKSGNRIRITAQLVDADNGAHVWGERYDRAVDDIFAVQDEMTLVLATEMQVNLTEGEQARIRYTTTTNFEAWTLWVQGLSHFRQPVTKDRFGPARTYWERALALDPNSAALNGMLAFMQYADARFGWWDDRETALKKGLDYVDRAFAIDPENSDAHTSLSLLLMVMGRHEEAVAHARKAIEKAPGSADAATFACFVLASSGYAREAVVQIEKAMTLSPNYPAYYLGHLGNAYRLSGRFDDAIAAFKAFHERSPGFGLTDLVIVYRQAGQHALAERTAKEFLSVRPDFTIEGWRNTQFRSDANQLEADAVALRAAGLPES